MENGKLKDKIKIILAVGALSTLMVGTVVASNQMEKIDVVLNSINLKVDGKPVEEDNILYKGTTYIPLRASGEILDLPVDWDENTRTASVGYNSHIPRLINGHFEDHLDEADKVETKKDGSMENPVGIPSTAILTEYIAEENTRVYNYRLNLPDGAYIEKVICSNRYLPEVTFIGTDENDKGLIASVNTEGKVTYSHFGELPEISGRLNSILKNKGIEFLEAHGY